MAIFSGTLMINHLVRMKNQSSDTSLFQVIGNYWVFARNLAALPGMLTPVPVVFFIGTVALYTRREYDPCSARRLPRGGFLILTIAQSEKSSVNPLAGSRPIKGDRALGSNYNPEVQNDRVVPFMSHSGRGGSKVDPVHRSIQRRQRRLAGWPRNAPIRARKGGYRQSRWNAGTNGKVSLISVVRRNGLYYYLGIL
ncbi:hypothetical protein FA13DRAFT_1775132, partial [Coprinellus micaceus]